MTSEQKKITGNHSPENYRGEMIINISPSRFKQLDKNNKTILFSQ